ncbi:MAG: hypothetical protein ACLVFG_03285 [Lachnospiraceae bacterium]
MVKKIVKDSLFLVQKSMDVTEEATWEIFRLDCADYLKRYTDNTLPGFIFD